MRKVSTSVLSARVPDEVIKEIDRACKRQGISRSQWIIQTLASDKGKEVMKLTKGGKLKPVQSEMMPVDLQNTLAGLGILTVGVTMFSIVRELLTTSKNEDGTPKFTHQQVEFITLSTIVILAIAGIGAFDALMKE